MLFALPSILIGKTCIGEDGKLSLKEPYTPEEKRVLDEFKEKVKKGLASAVGPLEGDDSDGS